MPSTTYLKASQVDLAYKIAKGEIPPDGFRVLTKSEYFSRPVGMCVHPQGWPCFVSCLHIDTKEKT